MHPACKWWEFLATSLRRRDCSGCVLSDGHFAALGCLSNSAYTSSYKALTFGADGSPSMYDSWILFACAAVAKCFIVAGGWHRTSAEVYDKVLVLWFGGCDFRVI